MHCVGMDALVLPGRLACRRDLWSLSIVTVVADVFDALLSVRPDKPAWPLERIVEHMRAQAGRQFDPRLIAIFLDHLDDMLVVRALCRRHGGRAAFRAGRAGLSPPPPGAREHHPVNLSPDPAKAGTVGKGYRSGAIPRNSVSRPSGADVRFRYG